MRLRRAATKQAPPPAHTRALTRTHRARSVKKMLALACARAGCAHVEAPLRFPLCGDAAVVAAVAASLPPNAALVVLDAVASNTALRLPVASLVALVRARCPARCRVVVDAAHLLGAEPLPAGGFPALGADVVAANCHKWLCAHRGCAVLWASAGARAGGGLPPPVVSHGLGAGFASEWAWDGNRDYAPLLALGPALEWWGRVGPERGRAYMAATLRAAVLLLVRRWGTHPLLPPSLWPSAMACVRLPFDALPQQRGGGDGAAAAAPRPAGPGADCGGGGGDDDNALLARPPPAGDGPATGGGAKEVQDFLFGRRVEVPVKCVQGHLYVRLSAHVYNVEADYQRLAEEVLRAAGWGG